MLSLMRRWLVALAILPSLAVADTAVPAPSGGVPCQTVADCWLDDAGRPIKRPARFRGKRIPRGDCGGNLLWLRHRLSCEQHQCVAFFLGDRC